MSNAFPQNTGSQGPPGPLAVVVSSPGALASVPTTGFVLGTLAYVQTPANYWSFYPNSYATPTGAATVVGVNGIWAQTISSFVQVPGVTAANATGALSLAQLQNTCIESSGNSSGSVAITAAQYIHGMQWICRNNNTGGTTTFFGIAVAVGHSAIVRINSSGAGERVTPDT